MNLIEFIVNNINKSDSEIANLANTPVRRLKNIVLTKGYILGAQGLGIERGAPIVVGLRMAADADPNSVAALVYSVLGEGGVLSTDPQLPTVTAQIVAAGICTQQDIWDLLYITNWPVSGRFGDVTLQEIIDNRVFAERYMRLNRMNERIVAFQNEVLNPAMSNFNLSEPSSTDLKTFVDGE